MADALPALRLPRGLPKWLAAGHAVDLRPVYADTAMSTGHARRRRIYRSAPRVVSVEMFLRPGQSAVFWDWYENVLQAGSRAFSAQVPNQGPGLLWWRAEFVGPPEYTATPRGAFGIRAKLLLTGAGSVDGPPDDSALATLSLVVLAGSAALTVRKPLASVSLVELRPAARLSSFAEVSLAGSAVVTLSRHAVAADSVTTGDACTALPSLSAAVADSAVTSDAAVTGTAFARTATESAATSDSASSAAAIPGLLYASFADGTAADSTPSPATVSIAGTSALFSGGKFVETDGGVAGYGRITWSASKFIDIASQPFTIECDVAWTTLPNVTFSEIVGVYNNSGSSRSIGFYASAGALSYDGTNSGVSISSGATRHHIAIVVGDADGGTLYVDGSRVLTGHWSSMAGASFSVVAGKNGYQGACDYSIDNVRLRAGAVYSGATITPPTYP